MNIISDCEEQIKDCFEKVDEIKEYNQEKVLEAFKKNKIGAEHFSYVSGYGHDDIGREVLDNLFRDIFKTEKAIVRNHFVSGTHAIACAISGNLKYGDSLVSIAGTPYDTMEEVIGTRGDSELSLIKNGVQYSEIPLKEGLFADFDSIKDYVKPTTKMVLIQRSRGYSQRNSLSISDIERIVNEVKFINPECICFVDNCYGEFVEKKEPLEVGADIIAGSLIKNPGGGIVETGGYIAGKEKYVKNAAERLTAPGIGEWGGSMLNQTRLIMQGVFMAPSIVADAVKGVILMSKVFETMGFDTHPKSNEPRTDIIQTIAFHDKDKLINFCKAIQENSPVDSYVTPIPDDVPGYEDKLIMAGGTFIEGSTIELSADGPLREPYAVYIQGGLNYAHIKIALKKALEKMTIINI
ncbi:methionine gamma-lyase family protein [bacterium]|nr:methionine gamma-lyase family protein [bacterium]